MKPKITRQAQEKGSHKWKIATWFQSKLMLSISLNTLYRKVLTELEILWFFALACLHCSHQRGNTYTYQRGKTYTLNCHSQTFAKLFGSYQLSSETHRWLGTFSYISTPCSVPPCQDVGSDWHAVSIANNLETCNNTSARLLE